MNYGARGSYLAAPFCLPFLGRFPYVGNARAFHKEIA